jgi:hypothetical protein
MGKEYNKSKNLSLMPIITHDIRLTGRLQENQSATSICGHYWACYDWKSF